MGGLFVQNSGCVSCLERVKWVEKKAICAWSSLAMFGRVCSSGSSARCWVRFGLGLHERGPLSHSGAFIGDKSVVCLSNIESIPQKKE